MRAPWSRRASVIAVAMLALAACGGGPEPEATVSAGDAVPTHHLVGVREVAGEGEFYVVATGETYDPRGVNYNRWLATAATAVVRDNLLSIEHYDPSTVEADFARIEALGFHTVRIMIDVADPLAGHIAQPYPSEELEPRFLDNIADLLAKAEAHGFTVILASNTLPDESWWVITTGNAYSDEFVGASNEFFTPLGVEVYADYWTKVVQGLVDRGAPTHVVLGYQLRQEYHVYLDQPPFALTSGMVTAANGETYDMSVESEKERLYDEGTTYFADTLRAAIREVDPTALVTLGFFTPNAPHQVQGPNELRLVRTAYVLRNSQLDFVDLHHYSGNGVSDADAWENFGIHGAERMPIILGEYGAYASWYPDAESAAAAVVATEISACEAGFEGSLMWAWRGDLSTDVWWATDAAGALTPVGVGLAPVNRPDHCDPGDLVFESPNLALTATVTASSEVAGFEAEYVRDGTDHYWNAAESAPQSIELVLSAPATVAAIELEVAQFPAGPTTHELWVEVAGGTLERVAVFDGTTVDGDVLTWSPDQPVADVVRVSVVTTALEDLAPAWREIRVLSPGGAP